MNETLTRTSDHYGTGWLAGAGVHRSKDDPWHFDRVREVIDFPVNQDGTGLEAGGGDGRDTIRLALANPAATIYAVDLSEGAGVAEQRLHTLGITNARVFRCNLADLPFDSGSIDWCYSFGVLHHMERPEDGIRDIGRVLKPGARIVTYLYSDLREHPVLRVGLVAATALRTITRRLPLPVLAALCWTLAVPVYGLLTLPCRAFGVTSLPYTSERSLRQVWGGLYDRLGAQIEYRYNRDSLAALYHAGGLRMEGAGHIPGWRGWVSWGRRV